MKSLRNKRSFVLNTDNDYKIIFIRLIVGLIFLSEGIQKYLFLQILGPGRFQELGFGHAYFWAYFTGAFEVICAILVLFGMLTRPACVPLLVIMITAFITTKLPILRTKGFFTFLHEYNTDFALTLLLIILLIYGGGKWSLDQKFITTENP